MAVYISSDNILKHLRRLLIRRSDCMRVDICGCRRLRMPRSVAHRLQRNPRCKQQRDVRVPQGMNRNLR